MSISLIPLSNSIICKMQNRYKHTLAKLIAHKELTHCEIIDFIGLVNRNELNDAQIAAFLVALLMKGATGYEVTSIAKAMRENCVQLKPNV